MFRLRRVALSLLSRLREDAIVARIALVFALFEISCSFWDLPSSFGWENDGIAPRDLFGGLWHNLRPGGAHRYPLLHYVLTGIAALPALLAAVLSGDDFSGPAVQARVLSVPCMTAVSVVAKLLSVGMAALALVTLARIARRLHSVAAGRFTAAWLAVMVTFAYYGRTSNLDVPYLCWSVLALDRLLDVQERGARRDFVILGLLVAAAVATKDQAYAGFALTAPVFLALALLNAPRPKRPAVARHLAACGVAALSGYALASGALVNPSGFVARLRLLTGTNSQDWKQYESGATGVLSNLRDLFASQSDYAWSWPVVALAWGGVLLAIVGPGPALRAPFTRALRLLPLCYALSHVACFALVVGRSQHRFVLPALAALAVYAGQASAALFQRFRPPEVRRGLTLAFAVLLAWNTFRVTLIGWVGFRDARHAVEDLIATLPAGARVETYGLLVYQPRYDLGSARVTRVDPRASARGQNPLNGMAELRAPYGAVGKRRPDAIVVPEYFADRFLARPLAPGQIVSPRLAHAAADRDARGYFAAVYADRVDGYRSVLDTGPLVPRWFESVVAYRIHGTLGGRYRVLVATGTDHTVRRGHADLAHPGR